MGYWVSIHQTSGLNPSTLPAVVGREHDPPHRLADPLGACSVNVYQYPPLPLMWAVRVAGDDEEL